MTTQTPADGGTPPADAAPPPTGAPGPATGFFQHLRAIGLYRSEERWVGGVAGGLAARFGLDPLLVRGLFLVTLLLGGFGLVLYALGWALLPEERDGRIHLEGLTLGHPDIALLGALAMFVVGIGRGAWTDWPLVVPHWLQGMFWFGTTVLVIVLLVTMLSRRRPTGPVPPIRPMPPYTGPAAPGTAGPFGGPVPTYGPTSPAPSAPPTMPSGPTAYAATSARGPVSSPVPPASAWTPPPTPAPAPTPYRYAAATAPAPIAAPRPPRPPRLGPGATTVGVTVALSLFVVAGALIAQRAGWLDRPTAATAAALVVLIFGAAIVVSGLRGRRSGVLGFLAIVATIVALPLTAAAHSDWAPWTVDRDGVHASQGTTTVTDRATAAKGVQVSFGDSTVDLSRLELTPDAPLTVPVHLGAGDFVVVVPHGAKVSAAVNVGAGQVTWRVGGEDTTYSGLGIGRKDFGVASDEAELTLNVYVGAGNLTIEEASR